MVCRLASPCGRGLKRFRFTSVADHVSAQYIRIANTMESYSRILTDNRRLFCRQMQSSLLKAEFALLKHVHSSFMRQYLENGTRYVQTYY